MSVNNLINYKSAIVENITNAFDSKNVASVDILRLDKIHEIISGNKWYKLKYYLETARDKQRIITFGGAYSNHLVATAFAAKVIGKESIGIVRGEEPATYSPSLKDSVSYGMQLIFVPRESYKNRSDILDKINVDPTDDIVIDEGGFGETGVKGAADILELVPDLTSYTHILCAVGTGTMLAGIVRAAQPHQHVIGISAVKGADELTPIVSSFQQPPHAVFEINFNYHHGGYAKKTPVLIDFMNTFYQKTGIPTDFVYSGKLLFAVNELIKENYFPHNSSLLVIHCGGIQGNRSLPAGMLQF
ncbi:1-aminocyclopropane-1-carboxylate deaminase/D-cysteine desulfhydrase [Pinibacter soli]|uniref:Pyridoxal-phosphate dependent enzyme n=1 Tax=Pinibacter soli TaxID=3044211 RepID=A0ABT6RIT3_9BACT|nr:pyridoxal-phosphate dependent enzyme [Pinibacter soli]MDI3321779.1 pyridoxal-phosphate dependent enzyme [Pinibacter soli]